MRRVVLFLIVVLSVTACAASLNSVVASAFDDADGMFPDEENERAAPEDILRRQWESIPTEPLDAFIFSLDPEVGEHIEPIDFRAIIFEGKEMNWSRVGQSLVRVFWSEIIVNVHILIQLMIVGLLSSVLQVIASSWGNNGATQIAFYVSLLILLFLGLKAFERAVDVASLALDHMVDLLHALLPLMSMMLAAVGAVTTAAIFHPLIYTTVTGVATIVRSTLFPIVLITVMISVVGSLSPRFPIKRLEGLLRRGALSLLTLLFIVFVTVVQARSVVAPVADGFAMKTVKFLTSTFIPVVGGRVADAMDLIVGGSVLIKNAVGLFGMGAVIVLTAFPIIKILAMLVMFRLCAAFIEPITDDRIIQAMSGMASGIGLIAAGVITAALMFFIGIIVVVSVGNTTAIMR